MTYEEFLQEKVVIAPSGGFDITENELSPILLPHQRDIVMWAVKGGNRAIFANFGLGKSVMQCEWTRLIHSKAGGKTLVICPLGVRQEIIRDAKMVGLDLRFIRRPEEMEDGHDHFITNYESVRDGKLDPNLFSAVSLDEASVLRSYGSKTYQEFLTLFRNVKYKLVNTATPSPNRYKELIHYAGFLGVMDTGEALAQPLTSSVLTPNGWKTMGDIKPGSMVIAANGKPTKVLAINPRGTEEVFKVTFDDGTSTRCTADHLWLTQTQYERNNAERFLKRNPSADDSRYWTVKSTSEIMGTLKCESTGSRNHMIPMVEPVEFTSKTVSVDPWLMGYLLGNGTLRDTSIYFATADDWVVEEIKNVVKQSGLFVSKSKRTRKDGQPCYDYWISAGHAGKTGRGHESNAVLKGIRRYGLIGKRAWEKSVPEDYLFNDAKIRLSLLQGLLDSDGSCSETGTVRFDTTSEALAEQVVFLTQSMGGTTYVRKHIGKKPNGEPGRLQYRVTLRLPNNVSPFRMPRKASRIVQRDKYPPKRYITSVEPDGFEQVQCIYVEDDKHLYVTDSFILTHNTRFFKRDSTKANNLTLYPSKEKEFWMWMSSWAVFVRKPSDLGYSDEGYNLPDIEVVYHEIPNDYSLAGHDKWGQAQLFQNNAMGLSAAAKEKRDSMNARIAKVKEIVDASPDDHFVIWHTLEAERHEIQKAIPEAQSVWGSQNLEQREERIVGFGDGKFRILSTKPVIAGSGCNFQRYCHREIFSGIGYEFNDFIQAIHRVQRFQQEHPVRIDIVYTESEQDVLRALKLKWQQHNELTQKMTEIIKEYGLSVSAMSEKLKKAIGIKRIEVSGDLYTVANNDCVKEAHLKGDNSVDLIITSIPFSNHYQYSANYNDFGDTRNNDHFWKQMDFLTPELLRILKPGRLYCCHVKDRILFGNVTGAGAPTVSPFHAEAIFHAQKHGFDYMGMITVVTDVVRENNQTYRLGWTENSKDGSKMGVGSPEYVLLFRKPQTDRSKGYADVPVTHDKQEYTRSRWQVDAHAFWRDGGNRQMTPSEIAALGPAKLAKLYTDFSLQNVYNYEQHVKIGEELDAVGALPSTFMALAPGSHCADVWHDVVRMQTLNGEQSKQNLEQHICPLQYGIVDRLIDRYSNKGELVYDPFCGLGTVPYRAILKGRKGGGSELNTQYFLDSCQYLKAAEQEVNMPDLFSALEA